MNEYEKRRSEIESALADTRRLATRNTLLVLCGMSLVCVTVIGLLLPAVFSMPATGWLVLLACGVNIAASIKLLRWRRAYRLLSFKHFPTELGRGRLHKRALLVHLIAFFVAILATSLL